MGNYAACLIEWLFQDNREDVSKLKDEQVNKLFVDAVVEGIMGIENYVKSKIDK